MIDVKHFTGGFVETDCHGNYRIDLSQNHPYRGRLTAAVKQQLIADFAAHGVEVFNIDRRASTRNVRIWFRNKAAFDKLMGR